MDDASLYSALVVLGIEPTPELCEQLDTFLAALEICEERTSAYGQVWRQYGARSNLLSVARKTDRLMGYWWFHTEEPAKGALDDAYDLLNYCAFFIRNAKEGNVNGTPPVRIVKKEGTGMNPGDPQP